MSTATEEEITTPDLVTNEQLKDQLNTIQEDQEKLKKLIKSIISKVNVMQDSLASRYQD